QQKCRSFSGSTHTEQVRTTICVPIPSSESALQKKWKATNRSLATSCSSIWKDLTRRKLLPTAGEPGKVAQRLRSRPSRAMLRLRPRPDPVIPCLRPRPDLVIPCLRLRHDLVIPCLHLRPDRAMPCLSGGPAKTWLRPWSDRATDRRKVLCQKRLHHRRAEACSHR